MLKAHEWTCECDDSSPVSGAVAIMRKQHAKTTVHTLVPSSAVKLNGCMFCPVVDPLQSSNDQYAQQMLPAFHDSVNNSAVTLCGGRWIIVAPMNAILRPSRSLRITYSPFPHLSNTATSEVSYTDMTPFS
jgi:hypothetical protein